jgi:iron complex outermembrane recepter protein
MFTRRFVTGVVCLKAMTLASTALAQVAAPAVQTKDAPTKAEVQEIIVTGSRIARESSEAATPILVVQPTNIVNSIGLAESFGQLPQAVATVDATSARPGAQATLNLRGIGGNRTLVLLDGHRLPITTFGTVDVNQIPRLAVESIDVVTGGASSIYGSDAIAGVVNFKLKTNYNGLSLDAQLNGTTAGPASGIQLSALWGATSADDRIKVMVSADYRKRYAISTREFDYSKVAPFPFGLNYGGLLVNGANLPNPAVVNSVFAKYGVAPFPVPQPIYVNHDGTVFQATPGLPNFRDNPNSPDFVTFAGLLFPNSANSERTEINRPGDLLNVFGRASYEFSSAAEVYGEVMVTRNNDVPDTYSLGFFPNPPVTMPVTNKFIPSDLKTILASRANPTADFGVNTLIPALPGDGGHNEINALRISAGIRGELPVSDLAYDVYWASASYDTTSSYVNIISRTKLMNLLAAPDGGLSLCGDAAYNPFADPNSISAGCRAYISKTPISTTDTSQNMLAGSLTGTILQLPAGPLKFAAGFEYRQDKVVQVADSDIYTPGEFLLSTVGKNLDGEITTTEEFGELLIPLIKDTSFIQKLDLDLSARHSDYTIGGSNWSYAATANWQVNNILRFRGGYARATRAPNFSEAFQPRAGGLGASIGLPAPNSPGNGDPCDIVSYYRTNGPNPAQVRSLCLAQGVPSTLIDTFTNTSATVRPFSGGSTALKPEKADTFTIGTILGSPFNSPMVSNLNLTIDYYNINLKGAISPLPATTAVDSCFTAASNPTFSNSASTCPLLGRDTSSGALVNVDTPLSNLGGIKTSGIDIGVNWGIPLHDVGAEGVGDSIIMSANVTHVFDVSLQALPGQPFVNYTGTTGGPLAQAGGGINGTTRPAWKSVTSFAWKGGAFTAGVAWRYIGPVKDATTPVVYPAYNYFDLSGSYQLTDAITFTAGLNNLTNKEPWVSATYTYDASTYDALGRTFYLRLQGRF